MEQLRRLNLFQKRLCRVLVLERFHVQLVSPERTSALFNAVKAALRHFFHCITTLITNLPTSSMPLIPSSSSLSCSSNSSSGTGLRLESIRWSRAFPAALTLLCFREATRLENEAASRDRRSAILNRSLRESTSDGNKESDVVEEASETMELLRLTVGVMIWEGKSLGVSGRAGCSSSSAISLS